MVVISRDIAWSALDVVGASGGILMWRDNLVVVLQMVEGASTDNQANRKISLPFFLVIFLLLM